MDELETGIVKWFSDTKGYGFITRDSGEDCFVHHTGIAAEGFKTLSEGQRVEFQIVTGDRDPKSDQVIAI